MTIIVVPERKHCPVPKSARNGLSYKAEKGAAVSLICSLLGRQVK